MYVKCVLTASTRVINLRPHIMLVADILLSAQNRATAAGAHGYSSEAR